MDNKELLKLQIQRNEVIDQALSKAIASGKATQQVEDELIKRRTKYGQETELLRIKLEKILETERQINAVIADQAISLIR